MKKYIDTKEILNKPKQSLLEKWYEWALKNAVVASMFAVIVSWVNKAAAEKVDAWNVALGMSAEELADLATRNFYAIIFFVGSLILLILLVFSALKKICWYWFFILLGLLLLFALIPSVTNRMIFVSVLPFLLTTFILSIFKKLHWRWFFILVGLLIGFAIVGYVTDYMDEADYSSQKRVVLGDASLETETDKAK